MNTDEEIINEIYVELFKKAKPSADFNELKSIVLRKLNAAKGGGFIFQSDNSVPENVTPERYECVINLVREYGKYPLHLGEYDIPDLI